MSQRDSGYERKERDLYETPAWVTLGLETRRRTNDWIWTMIPRLAAIVLRLVEVAFCVILLLVTISHVMQSNPHYAVHPHI